MSAQISSANPNYNQWARANAKMSTFQTVLRGVLIVSAVILVPLILYSAIILIQMSFEPVVGIAILGSSIMSIFAAPVFVGAVAAAIIINILIHTRKYQSLGEDNRRLAKRVLRLSYIVLAINILPALLGIYFILPLI